MTSGPDGDRDQPPSTPAVSLVKGSALPVDRGAVAPVDPEPGGDTSGASDTETVSIPHASVVGASATGPATAYSEPGPWMGGHLGEPHPPAAAHRPPISRPAVAALGVAVVAGPVAIPLAHIAQADVSRSGRRGRGMALGAMALGYGWLGVGVGVLAAFVLLSQLFGTTGYQPITRTVTEASTATTTVSTPPITTGLQRSGPPPGATPCPTIGAVAPGAFTRSAAGTVVTSCEFADAVRLAYQASGSAGGARVVRAFSPVTRQDYSMNCRTEGPRVACRGGNDAVVLLYLD